MPRIVKIVYSEGEARNEAFAAGRKGKLAGLSKRWNHFAVLLDLGEACGLGRQGDLDGRVIPPKPSDFSSSAENVDYND